MIFLDIELVEKDGIWLGDMVRAVIPVLLFVMAVFFICIIIPVVILKLMFTPQPFTLLIGREPWHKAGKGK